MIKLMKLIKNKKGMEFEEIAKWIIIGILMIVIILAVIGPTRRAIFEKIGEFIQTIRFGV